MTDQTGMTLRQRIESHQNWTGRNAFPSEPTLDQRITELERELIDFGDRPRIAQIQRADERTTIENQLADLRLQRAESTDDEPLDAA